jgi:polyhydroxybutyrate depolymerase
VTVRALRRWTLLVAALASTVVLAGPVQAAAPAGWSSVRLDAASRLPSDGPLRAEVQLVVDGRTRTFRVLVPPGLPSPAPLVVGLHGLHKTVEATDAAMRLLEQAPRRGFIAVYPVGVGASWNAGRCCGRAVVDRVDDLAFLRRVVAEVAAARPVDRTRVTAVGWSNGGMLAHRAACEAPGLFTAVAVVAGADVTGRPCSGATATMVVHGLRDGVVPAGGGATLGTLVPPLAQTVAVLERRGSAYGVRTSVVRLPAEGHGWPTTRTVSGYDTTGHVLDFLLRSRPVLRRR